MISNVDLENLIDIPRESLMERIEAIVEDKELVKKLHSAVLLNFPPTR